MAGVPFGLLAHVEHLEPVALVVQLLDGHPRDPRDGQPLLAPAREPAGEEAAQVRDADGGRELGGVARVVVVAADQHDGLLAVGDPGELRAEARPAAP